MGDSRVFEQVFDSVFERWNLFRVADGDVGCQGVLGRADGPDVQVVDICDSGVRIEDLFPDPLAVDPGSGRRPATDARLSCSRCAVEIRMTTAITMPRWGSMMYHP